MGKSVLAAVKNGDKAAFDELLAAYEPLVRAECARLLSKFPDFASEAEELRQEGRLALYNAAMAYEEGEVTFGLYAKICVRNRLISYIRKLGTAKRREARIAERELALESKSTAEELVLAIESSERLRKMLDSCASAYEKRVFSMYLQKMSYADIAAAVGKSVKSVDNAIARVKAKLKKWLKDADN